MALVKFAGLICLVPALSFAGSWSGALVDSNCYASRERNVNAKDTLTNVDRDTRAEIHYCSANARTKSFTLVQREGPSFRLDPAGNAKAAQLVQQSGKKNLLIVDVTGELNKDTVQVDSLTAAH